MLPHSDACERNKARILDKIKLHFANINTVLEIGSGTAQHAVYFAKNLPHLIWQTADRQEYIEGIQQRLLAEGGVNIRAPLMIDVIDPDWGIQTTNAIFSANTLHIMSQQNVEQFIQGCGKYIEKNGLLVVYGPFKYKGEFTSHSNAQFDASLKARGSQMGIRDFEWLNKLAKQQQFMLLNDYAMPANNQLLIWQKSSDC